MRFHSLRIHSRIAKRTAAAVLLALSVSAASAMELSVWKDPDFQQRFTESYIAVTEVEPRITDGERVILQEILTLIAAERVNEATARLNQEITGKPGATAVYDFTLANLHFQREEFDTAAELYLQAVDKFPKFRRAWKNLALIQVRQGNHADAIPSLTRVIELGGGDALTYGLLGFSYGAVENFLAAETAYRMAILLDATTLDWKLGLAQSYFRQQRFAEAATLCDQLIEGNPDRTDLWLLKANAHIGMAQPMEAAEIYELVDLLGGSTADSLYLLGDIYTNEELFELAADKYADAVALEEQGKTTRALRAARILAARSAFDETADLIGKIETHHGEALEGEDRKNLLKVKARIAVAREASDEEARVLEEIVELDPLDGEALILLGQHANRSGDTEKAIFYFQRAAAIEKFEADANVRHAQVLVATGKYDEALPLLRRSQQINYRENIQEYMEQVERVARSK